MSLHPALVLLVSYLCGSVPWGLLAGLLAGKDVRRHGSGNIGFTNVLRVCGAAWAAPVLVLDGFKGFAPAYWFPALLAGAGEHPYLAPACGVAAILGHNFPVWLRFRGGKGVATSAGVVLALMPRELGAALAAWVLAAVLTRYVSVASMLAAVVLVGARLYFAHPAFEARALPLTALSGLLCLLVLVRHRANVQRLLAGTENRIGAGNAQAEKPAPESGDVSGETDARADGIEPGEHAG